MDSISNAETAYCKSVIVTTVKLHLVDACVFTSNNVAILSRYAISARRLTFKKPEVRVSHVQRFANEVKRVD